MLSKLGTFILKSVSTTCSLNIVYFKCNAITFCYFDNWPNLPSIICKIHEEYLTDIS